MTTTCPACGGPPGPELLRRDAVPVLCNALHRDAASARAAPRGDIRLVACPGCGLVFNAAFDPARMRYDADYENALHFSPRFRAFQADTVRRLVEHGVRDRRVLEIGCGDGSFLVALAVAGGNRGVGVDPSFDPARARIPGGANVRVATAPFTAMPGAADAVVCRHVLEHLDDAARLLTAMRDALAGGDPGLVYLEVPSWRATLERDAFWDVLYEHVAYHDADTLADLVRRHGFEVLEAGEAYGGQFATVIARRGSRPAAAVAAVADAPEPPPVEGMAGDPAAVAAFAARENAFVRGWRRWIAAHSPGERLVVWGAGTKGAVLLDRLGEHAGRIAAAIDLNPRKQGCFVAGTGTPILGPDALAGLAPDVVLVMNPLYAREIRAELDGRGLATARLVLAGERPPPPGHPDALPEPGGARPNDAARPARAAPPPPGSPTAPRAAGR